MAYFGEAYMGRRRQQWLRSLAYVEAQTNGTWHRGTINQKKIEGENVVVMATFPTLDSIACTINASRLIDTYRLSFDDDALSVKVTKYQGDEARTLDVCMDCGGDLMLGTQPGGRYVAQIEIPAATYTETPIEPQEGADESGDTNRQTVERTKNPLDMAEVKLILWSIE